MPDSFDVQILEAIRPLVDRVRREAYEAGQRDALASLIQSAQSRLQNSHHAIPPPPALVADPEQTPPRSGVKRAPHGVVRNMVKEIVDASPEGIRQMTIIEMANGLHDFDLKPSSTRVALDSLARTGHVERRDGKWFPKGNGAPHAPLFNPEPSVQAVDAAGKEGGI